MQPFPSSRFRAALAGLAALFSLWAGMAQAGPFVQARGRDLIGPDGQVFLIRGIGLGNWLMPEGYMFKFKRARAPREISALMDALLGPEDAAAFWQAFRERYVAREDIQLIARAGFNTVRVPLHYGLFVTQNHSFGADSLEPMTFAGPGWELLDKLVEWCRESGLKVIIDLHAAPGGQTGVNHDDGIGFPLMFYLPREQRRTEAFWRELARRYAVEPTVLGYELLNEPVSTYSEEDLLNSGLEKFYKRLTSVVRQEAPHQLIFLASAQWDQNMKVFGPPFTHGLVYVYHQFWSTTGRDAIQDYINFANLYRVPILLGEAGEADDSWNWEYHRLNESFGFGWSFWTYKNLESSASVVNIPAPSGWDALVRAGGLDKPTLDAAGLDRQAAKEILWRYLDAIRLDNAQVNTCYIRSLGLGRNLPQAPCPVVRKYP